MDWVLINCCLISSDWQILIRIFNVIVKLWYDVLKTLNLLFELFYLLILIFNFLSSLKCLYWLLDVISRLKRACESLLVHYCVLFFIFRQHRIQLIIKSHFIWHPILFFLFLLLYFFFLLLFFFFLLVDLLYFLGFFLFLAQ